MIRLKILFFVVLALLVGCGAIYFIEGRVQKKSGSSIFKHMSTCVFAGYIIFIILATLIIREPAELDVNLTPFDSLITAVKYRDNCYAEVLIWNIIVYIPFGLLLPLISKLQPLTVLICGTGFSLMIEVIQLITKRGVFDVDDLIVSFIGTVIGYYIFAFATKLISKSNGKLKNIVC